MNHITFRLASLIGLAWCLAFPPVSAEVYEWRTVAGHSGGGGFRDGVGDAARFLQPRALVLDAAGNLLVGDMYNNAIRVVSPSRVVTTLARSGDEFNIGWISDFGSDAAGNV